MFEKLKKLCSSWWQKEETSVYRKKTTDDPVVKVEKHFINTLTKAKKSYLKGVAPENAAPKFIQGGKMHKAHKVAEHHLSSSSSYQTKSSPTPSPVVVNYKHPQFGFANGLGKEEVVGKHKNSLAKEGEKLVKAEDKISFSENDSQANSPQANTPQPVLLECYAQPRHFPDKGSSLAVTANGASPLTVKANIDSSLVNPLEAKLQLQTPVADSELASKLQEGKSKEKDKHKNKNDQASNKSSSKTKEKEISVPLSGGRVVTSCNFDLRSVTYVKKRENYRLIDLVDIENVYLDLTGSHVKSLLSQIVNKEFNNDIDTVNSCLRSLFERDLEGSQYLGDDIVLMRTVIDDEEYRTKAFLAPLRKAAIYNSRQNQQCKLLMVLLVGKREVKEVNKHLPSLISKLKLLATFNSIFFSNVSSEDVWQLLALCDWKRAKSKARAKEKELEKQRAKEAKEAEEAEQAKVAEKAALTEKKPKEVLEAQEAQEFKQAQVNQVSQKS